MTDSRSTAAVDAALRYAAGEISRAELNVYAAADTIRRFAAYAAFAAASTSYHAWAVAYTAAHAAVDAIDTADDAARVAARDANRRQTADICREVLTEAVFEKVKQLQNDKNHE
jgi:hypothetical protein